MRDNLRRRKDRGRLNAQCLGSKALQFFAKDHRIRAACLDKFQLLRGKGWAQIDQLLALIIAEQLFLFRIDSQHRAGIDCIFLFQNRIAIIIQNRLTTIIQLFDPVFQVNPDAACHPDSGLENRGNAICARHNRGDIHKRNIGAGLFACPKRNIIDA